MDVTFAAAIVACAITAYVTRTPALPAGVCRTSGGAPRWAAMLADGRITIAAVFGELAGGPTDHNAWSYRAFARALRERGFVETDADRYELGDVTIDLALIADDTAQTSAALAGALASHDVVYYNGHSHDGDIAIKPAAGYRVIVLDSCWSSQHYAARLVASDHDVITNSERSVTGSIESFLVLVDALRARVPHWPLAEMNRLAAARAEARASVSKLKQPERYAVDVSCR